VRIPVGIWYPVYVRFLVAKVILCVFARARVGICYPVCARQRVLHVFTAPLLASLCLVVWVLGCTYFAILRLRKASTE